MPTSKERTLNTLFETLKTMYSGKYLVLRNVEISSILPFANLARDGIQRERSVDLVLARKDYSPLLVIDVAKEYQKKDEREEELSKERALLIDARIPVLHLESSEVPSQKEIELIVEEAEINHAKLISDLAQDMIGSSHEKRIEEKQDTKLKEGESPGNTVLKRYAKAFVILLAGFAVFHFAIPKNKKPQDEMNLGIQQGKLQVPAEQEEQINYQKRKRSDATASCEPNPPQNGSIKVLNSNIHGEGKAFWRLDNKSNMHVIASVVFNSQKLSEVYVAPNSETVFATYPLQFNYIIYTSHNWCNSAKTINPGGYSGDSTSRGTLTSKFKNNTIATTSIKVINGNLNTNTEIEEVEGN